MSQPTIIGVSGSGNTRAYPADSDANANTRVFSNISIPANANTVIVMCGIDIDETSSDEKMTALTLSGITGFTELHDISISARDDFRATRLGIYDVRSCGAATATLTAQLSVTTAESSILGVVCTDGYIESFTIVGDRFVDEGEVRIHSGNMSNNLFVYMGVKQSTVDDMPFIGNETELFRTSITDSGGTVEIGAVAASQGTASESTYTVKFNNDASGAPLNTASLLISSQPNAFGDIDPRGDIISHDIITN